MYVVSLFYFFMVDFINLYRVVAGRLVFYRVLVRVSGGCVCLDGVFFIDFYRGVVCKMVWRDVK